jgi:hypothetical protein
LPAGSFILKSSAKTDDLLKNSTIQHYSVNNLPEVKKQDLTMPKIGLVESYFHDMDAGWTRFILDTYNVPYTIIRPGNF